VSPPAVPASIAEPAFAASVAPSTMRSLKIMTVNVHMGFAAFRRRVILSELRDAVRTVGADVVCLQEVLGVHEGHAARHHDWPDAPHYEFLADAMWPQFAYGRNAVYPEGHHGNALLSKFAIAGHTNHDVSIAASTGREPEKRGLLHCMLRVPGHAADVHVICAHLGLSEDHRKRQLDLLIRTIDTEVPAGDPLIVAGDFNDWRGRAHDILADGAGLAEVFVQARGAAARTFPARLPLLRLDRIYVRNAEAHAPVVLPRKPWSHLSDHAPLVAEIHL
jgi:endonuclease/exonuclease/phosphatase family metal-dependent hydrolase